MRRFDHLLIALAAIWLSPLSGFAQGPDQPVQVDINAEELLSGRADVTLKELGVRAVAENLAITVAAPEYWRERIVSALESGAGGDPLNLTYRETFAETVLVRLSPQSEAQNLLARTTSQANEQPALRSLPAPEAPTADTSELDRAAANMKDRARELVVSQADIPTAAELLSRPKPTEPSLGTAPRSPSVEADEDQSSGPGDPPQSGSPEHSMGLDVVASQDPAPIPSEPHPATVVDLETDGASPSIGSAEQSPGSDAVASQVPPTITSEPPAATAVDLEEDGVSPQPAVPARDGESASREAAVASLSRRLNDGRPIDRQLTVETLRARDRLFRTEGVIAVVRRSVVGLEVYLLEGELNLDNPDVRKLEAGKYEVLRRISVAGQGDSGSADAGAGAKESDQELDERQVMQALYNEGRAVDSTLSVAGLRADDVLYLGETEILVVRRGRVGTKRFWLLGELDLTLDELEHTGNRKYRVRRPIR